MRALRGRGGGPCGAQGYARADLRAELVTPSAPPHREPVSPFPPRSAAFGQPASMTSERIVPPASLGRVALQVPQHECAPGLHLVDDGPRLRDPGEPAFELVRLADHD